MTVYLSVSRGQTCTRPCSPVKSTSAPHTVSVFIDRDEAKWIAVPSFDRARQNLSKLVSTRKSSHAVARTSSRPVRSSSRFSSRTIPRARDTQRRDESRLRVVAVGLVPPKPETNTRDYARSGLVIICRALSAGNLSRARTLN